MKGARDWRQTRFNCQLFDTEQQGPEVPEAFAALSAKWAPIFLC